MKNYYFLIFGFLFDVILAYIFFTLTDIFPENRGDEVVFYGKWKLEHIYNDKPQEIGKTLENQYFEISFLPDFQFQIATRTEIKDKGTFDLIPVHFTFPKARMTYEVRFDHTPILLDSIIWLQFKKIDQILISLSNPAHQIFEFQKIPQQ